MRPPKTATASGPAARVELSTLAIAPCEAGALGAWHRAGPDQSTTHQTWPSTYSPLPHTRSRVDRGMGARATAARKAGRTCFLRCVLRCFLRLEHQGATALSQGCSLPHLAEVKCLVHVMKRMCHGTRSKQGRGRGSRQSITRKEQPAAHDPSCRRWACDRRSHD